MTPARGGRAHALATPVGRVDTRPASRDVSPWLKRWLPGSSIWVVSDGIMSVVQFDSGIVEPTGWAASNVRAERPESARRLCSAFGTSRPRPSACAVRVRTPRPRATDEETIDSPS